MPVIRIVVVGEDRASRPIGRVARVISNIGAIAGGILTAQVFSRIAGAISDMATEAFDAAAEFQALEIRLEGLVAREIKTAGGAESMAVALAMAEKPAGELLEWVKQLAVTTPFTAQSLSRATTLGLAMGFTTDQTKRLVQATGNFTAGMGLTDEVIERILYNFGQMIQQGKVTGTELRDLARGGFVPVTEVLHRMQDVLGDTQSWEDFREAAAKGTVDVMAFFEAFMQMAEEDFPDGMQRMAQSWLGVKNNIADFFQVILGAELLGPFMDDLSARVSDALNNMMTDETRENVATTGAIIRYWFQEIRRTVRDHLLPAISDLFDALGIKGPDSFDTFNEWLFQTFQKIRDFIKGPLTDFVKWMEKWLPDAVEMAGNVLGDVGDFFKSIGEEIVELFASFGVSDVELMKALGAAFLVFLGLSGVVAVISGIGFALGILLNPINLVIAGISLLAVAWKNNLGGIQDKAREFGRMVGAALDWLQDLIDRTLERARIGFEGLLNIRAYVIDRIVQWFRDMADKIAERINFVVGIFKFFSAMGRQIFHGIVLFITAFVQRIQHWLNEFKESVIRVFSPFAAIIGNQFELVKRIFEGFVDYIVRSVEFLVSAATEGFQRAVDGAQSIVDGVRNIITEFPQIAHDALQGFLDGLREKWREVRRWIDDQIGGLPDWIKDMFGISSRSKVMASIGRNLGEGLERGMTRSFKRGFSRARLQIARELGLIEKKVSQADFSLPEVGASGGTSRQTGRAGGGGGGQPRVAEINIYIYDAQDAQSVANEVMRKLRLQGIVA